MAKCDECGAFVTSEYKRVHSDNQGVLHGCLECAESKQKASVAASDDSDKIPL